MTMFYGFLILALLTLTGPAWAAEPKNPSPPMPQPVGAVRFWTQFEIYMLGVYRLPNPSPTVDSMEFGGGGSAGGAAGAGACGDGGTAAGDGAR